MNTAQMLIDIRKKFDLSPQELAQLLGTSLASISRWEDEVGNPSPAQAEHIINIHREIEMNPSSKPVSRAVNGIFSSRGARNGSNTSTPKVQLEPEPGSPILSRLMNGKFFSEKTGGGIRELLESHFSSALTATTTPSTGMSAGKNTYTYDAHTYHTKVPPQGIAELLKHYLPEGGLVFDPFAGSGMTGVAAKALGYDCILNELSPAACFIANRFNTQVDPQAYASAVETVLSELQNLRASLYTTTCRECKRDTEILYTIWSYNVVCNHCNHEFLLWDECRSYGRSVREHKILTVFPCPNCGESVKKSKLIRTTSHPVRVVYKCCDSDYKQHPLTKEDFERLRHIKEHLAPAGGFFPLTHLPDGFNLRQPKKHGLDRVDKFYSARNLIAMSHLWRTIHRVESRELAAHLAFTFTSLYQRVTQLSEFRFWGGSGNMARFNVPFIFKEANVFDTFARKARTIQDHLETTASHYFGKTVVVKNSATSLDYLPDRCIDFIFTDPPFGANINYSEMNLLWESWLGDFTDATDEAIINKFQDKGTKEYQNLMTVSLRECYRVLRTDHWMLLVFMNSSHEVWHALKDAVVNAGFVIRKIDIFDKQHGTFKQFVSANTAGADLVLHCYKPSVPTFSQFKEVKRNPEESIAEFLATIDIRSYTQVYLHVEREQEFDYRTLYSEWLSRALVHDILTVDFAEFRSIVEKWLKTTQK